LIKRDDLLEAIAECQGQKNPNANTCIKLAAYYTILDHLDESGEKERDLPPMLPAYSSSPGLVEYDSGTEFSDLISGANLLDVWPVIDELMSTLKVLYPKLYNGVMRKLDGL